MHHDRQITLDIINGQATVGLTQWGKQQGQQDQSKMRIERTITAPTEVCFLPADGIG